MDRRLCAGKYCRTSLYFRKPGGLALAAGISGVTSLADYAATLGHAGIATLATAPGRFAEAHAIVHRYFGPHVLLGDEVATATHKHIKTLFSSRYWRRTAFNSVFFVCLVIPWFVIYTWLPTIAQTIGLEDALTASLMLNALLIVGALLGLVLTHLLAHRKFCWEVFAAGGNAGSDGLFAFRQFINAAAFVLFSTTISAVSNLVGILPAESFPTDIRSLGVGFATAMSRLGRR